MATYRARRSVARSDSQRSTVKLQLTAPTVSRVREAGCVVSRQSTGGGDQAELEQETIASAGGAGGYARHRPSTANRDSAEGSLSALNSANDASPAFLQSTNDATDSDRTLPNLAGSCHYAKAADRPGPIGISRHSRKAKPRCRRIRSKVLWVHCHYK